MVKKNFHFGLTLGAMENLMWSCFPKLMREDLAYLRKLLLVIYGRMANGVFFLDEILI